MSDTMCSNEECENDVDYPVCHACTARLDVQTWNEAIEAAAKSCLEAMDLERPDAIRALVAAARHLRALKKDEAGR
jgi:hypothetical protein